MISEAQLPTFSHQKPTF